jgi:hypothetical protein
MRLPGAAPLPLVLCVLAACGDDGAEICAARHESYHVSAALSVRDPEKAAAEGAEAVAPLKGKLLVSVEQDRSILDCHDGLVSESYPAAPLLYTTVALSGPSFTLDVPSTIYPAIYVPMLWLSVRLDENGNGRCDDGEPAGIAELAREANASVQIELMHAACPLPAI